MPTFTIHLYSMATIEMQRSTLRRTYDAVAVHCGTRKSSQFSVFKLAERFRALGFRVVMQLLTGGDSGLKLVNNELTNRQLKGSALSVLVSTGVIVIANSGSVNLEYTGVLDLAQIGKFWKANAQPGDSHVLIGFSTGDEELLHQVLSSAPANTIYVPNIGADTDVFQHLPLLNAAPAIVVSEDEFARLAHQADPREGLTDFLERGVNSSIIVQENDRHWSDIAGNLRMTLGSQELESSLWPERFAELLLSVAKTSRTAPGAVGGAGVGALSDIEQLTVPPKSLFLSSLTQARRTSMPRMF